MFLIINMRKSNGKLNIIWGLYGEPFANRNIRQSSGYW